MANEVRLIKLCDATAVYNGIALYMAENAYLNDTPLDVLKMVASWLNEAPTVDAVEVEEIRDFAKDVVYQFGYYCQNKGRLHITHGGLSTLEQAFDILGWENPHPVPECECEIDGCHEQATCGAKTNDGYKRMCGRHYLERRTDK